MEEGRQTERKSHMYTYICTLLSLLCQAHGWKHDGEVQYVPFPFDRDEEVPIPEGIEILMMMC